VVVVGPVRTDVCAARCGMEVFFKIYVYIIYYKTTMVVFSSYPDRQEELEKNGVSFFDLLPSAVKVELQQCNKSLMFVCL